MPNPTKIEIDLDKLNKLLKLKPTLHDTAAFFDCDESTVVRRIKEVYGRTFKQQREIQASHTRHALVQKAVSEALDGNNTMLIFALKNLCDWKDKHELPGDLNVNCITDLLLTADKEILDVTPVPIKLNESKEKDDDND